MPKTDLKDLKKSRQARNKREFQKMRTHFTDRPTILATGDSWFDYPHKNFLGNDPNLIAWLSKWIKGKVNFYSIASNGDEAVDLVSGHKKHQLISHLRWHETYLHRKQIDLLLFSGGGNDVVGKNDFERFIYRNNPQFTTAKQYVNFDSLKRKIKQIGLTYQELLDIRDYYSPKTTIVTHTYDYPFPSGQGATFLGGLIKTPSWMTAYMQANEIPQQFHADIIKVVMDLLAEELIKISKIRDQFIVVDTRANLTGERLWLNEIHPTKQGFKLIAEIIYKVLQDLIPALK